MNRKITLSLGMLGLGVVLAGCTSNPPRTGQRADINAIANNLTPELMTLNERPIDVHRNMAYVHNHNGRQFWSDLGRVFVTDHPSRLSNIPVISTTGHSR